MAVAAANECGSCYACGDACNNGACQNVAVAGAVAAAVIVPKQPLV